MMRRLTVLLAICVASPTAAAVPDKFDLVCHNEGTITAPKIRPIGTSEEKHLTLDLGHKIWCAVDDEGACMKLPIESVKGDVLTLLDLGVGPAEVHIELDLAGPTYTSVMKTHPVGVENNTTVVTMKGSCKTASATPGRL